MNDIEQHIGELRKSIPNHVKLLCVSKFQPIEAIQKAYDFGERSFGESHAQELVAKRQALPSDIEWHFIGSLQTNKVKFVVPIATLIHSVDSQRLLAEIDKCAARNSLISNVLLEVHIAKETTKHGFSPDEICQFFADELWRNFPNVQICGLMTMGTAEAELEQTQSEFRQLKTLFDHVKTKFNKPYFAELSMGMSDDFRLAIEQGSTIVRIGSSIFGERKY